MLAILSGLVVMSVLAALRTSGLAGCSATQPCRPDGVGSVAIGLLVATMLSVYLHWRTAVWLATAAATAFALDRVIAGSDPWWTLAIHLGFAALLWYLPGDGSRAPHTDSAIAAAVPVAEHRTVPAEQAPRPGRPRWAAAALLAAGAVACAGWGAADQATGDARQRAAKVVTGVVLSHRDGVHVRLALPDRREVTVKVRDAADYPTGEQFAVYLDDDGFTQPVSEPYDATPWFGAATVLAMVATAAARNGNDRARAVRTLLTRPQPVRAVRAIEDRYEVRLYHPDPDGPARPLAMVPVRYANPPGGQGRWPRPAGYWTMALPRGADEDPPIGVERPGDADDPLTVADVLPPAPVPALLFGDPRSGGWCAVEVNGRIRWPRGPAHAQDDFLPGRGRPPAQG